MKQNIIKLLEIIKTMVRLVYYGILPLIFFLGVVCRYYYHLKEYRHSEGVVNIFIRNLLARKRIPIKSTTIATIGKLI